MGAEVGAQVAFFGATLAISKKIGELAESQVARVYFSTLSLSVSNRLHFATILLTDLSQGECNPGYC